MAHRTKTKKIIKIFSFVQRPRFDTICSKHAASWLKKGRKQLQKFIERNPFISNMGRRIRRPPGEFSRFSSQRSKVSLLDSCCITNAVKTGNPKGRITEPSQKSYLSWSVFSCICTLRSRDHTPENRKNHPSLSLSLVRTSRTRITQILVNI